MEDNINNNINNNNNNNNNGINNKSRNVMNDTNLDKLKNMNLNEKIKLYIANAPTFVGFLFKMQLSIMYDGFIAVKTLRANKRNNNRSLLSERIISYLGNQSQEVLAHLPRTNLRKWTTLLNM